MGPVPSSIPEEEGGGALVRVRFFRLAADDDDDACLDIMNEMRACLAEGTPRAVRQDPLCR
jgi:hypothetical protein